MDPLNFPISPSRSDIAPPSTPCPSSSSSTRTPMAALPRLTTMPARTPQNVDMDRLRGQVTGTLTGLVSGHLFGKSADSKAQEIVALLPNDLLTEERVAGLEREIKERPHDIERPLHHTGNQCGSVQGRATSRAVLVAELMVHGFAAALRVKQQVIAMSTAERNNYLNDTLVHMASAPPRERSDNLNSGASASSQVQSTTHSDTAEIQLPGTAAHPLTRQLRNVQDARDLTAQACQEYDGAEPPSKRLAWINKPATSANFVLTHSLSPCMPVVVFWKGADQVQKATLFHLNGWASDGSDIRSINDPSQGTDRPAQIDSISFVERRINQESGHGYRERLIGGRLKDFAKEKGLPYHLIHHDEEKNMSVIVNVKRREITTISDDYMTAPDHYMGKRYVHPLPPPTLLDK